MYYVIELFLFGVQYSKKFLLILAIGSEKEVHKLENNSTVSKIDKMFEIE
jgi:hypothetical protein